VSELEHDDHLSWFSCVGQPGSIQDQPLA
jgi:hypothetical protein